MDIKQSSQLILSEIPNRCIIIMDKELKGGHLANAIAVIALTVGQRHSVLIGEPLVDASGFPHPGLIPTGIPMLCASKLDLVDIRKTAIENGCDVVDFPVQGQQTKDYARFIDVIAQIQTQDMKYTGIAIIGQKKIINKICRRLEMIS